jgi:hypothetical protein
VFCDLGEPASAARTRNSNPYQMESYSRQDVGAALDEGLEDDFALDALDDGDDIHTKPEANHEQRFKDASKEIKQKKRFVNENDVDEFFRQYDDIAGQSLARVGGNLLHALVEVVKHTDEIQPEHVKLLVQRLVEKHPNLLTALNNDKYNPVFMAIRASQHQLVNYMMPTREDQRHGAYGEYLDLALSLKAQDGNTCLHIAFKDDLNPETTRLLIENASDKALAVQNDLGKTPMHYAVSFKQCKDARAELISLFIERDLKAIQSIPRPQRTFLDLPDKGGPSIYLEHQTTRAVVYKHWGDFLENLEKKRQAAESKQNQTDTVRLPDRAALGRDRTRTDTRDPRQAASTKPADDRGAERHGGSGDADAKLDEREKLRQMKKAEEAAARNYPARERDSIGRDPGRNQSTWINESDNAAQLAIRVGNAAEQLQSAPVPNTPIRRSSTAQFDSRPDQKKEKAPERPTATPRNSSTSSHTKMDNLRKNSDEILLSLKLHYMRTRSAEMAISFLYGTNMDGECHMRQK